ncbi:oxidase UstYa family protein [Microdochium nivale]|nr:oxidase UstYa family protein [Microdochium nivale]
MAEKTEEYDPLYTSRSSGDKSESDYDDDAEMKSLAQRSRRSSRWQRLRPWALHLGLPLLYTAMFLGSVYSRPAAGTFSLLDSPAKYIGEKTHLEAFPLEGKATGPYTGEPRKELDDAWRELLQYNNIRIPDDWIMRFGRAETAVKLPDGGYLGMLTAYHEIHCVKRLYQSLHREHYMPNSTAEELEVNMGHDLHCLEVLRMGAMCRGDVSVITHRWKEGSIKPNVEQRAPHQCVDWDAVTGFAAERTVDIWQEGYIRNPNTGVYPFAPPGGSSSSHQEHEHMHNGGTM